MIVTLLSDLIKEFANARSLDSFTDEELGTILKTTAYVVDKKVNRRLITGPLYLIRMAQKAGGTSMICPITLPSPLGDKWFIEVSLVRGPDGTEIKDPKRRLYSALEEAPMEEGGTAIRQATRLKLRLLSLFWKLPFTGRSGVPLLDVPSADLGAVLRQFMVPYPRGRGRRWPLFAAADLLNGLVSIQRANATTSSVELLSAYDSRGIIGDIKVLIWREGELFTEAPADAQERTWYASHAMSFGEFADRFETVYSMNKHYNQKGRIEYVTVKGVLKE